ncbi:MAG: NlpC/P60 family protein [Lachnospiraceae bacterium]|nr:NlpC/P60 family protein [Lachnospiraceae bacterium]
MSNRKMKFTAFGMLAAAVMISNMSLTAEAGILPSAGAGNTLNKPVEITQVAVADATVAPQTTATEVVAEQADDVTVVDAAAALAQERAEEEKQFANLVIAQCNDYVNVRQEPSEEAEILGKLYDESVGEFVSEAEGGWYEITSGSVTGYVKAEYVVTGEDAIALAKEVGKRIATVTTTTLFVREEPTTESSTIGMVPIEDELTVTEEEGLDGWVKVSVEEGEGYVSTEFVTLSTEFVKAESKAEEEARKKKEEDARSAANAAADKKSSESSGSAPVASGGSGRGSAVANFALQFVGNPYVYGGSSLTNGTDCSGFVMAVYANFGVGLPHSSGAQRGCGYDVGGIGNAQPGDIVCYSGHVGIYIGGGQIVHASTAATGIKVSNANYRSILSVRRIF